MVNSYTETNWIQAAADENEVAGSKIDVWINDGITLGVAIGHFCESCHLQWKYSFQEFRVQVQVSIY